MPRNQVSLGAGMVLLIAKGKTPPRGDRWALQFIGMFYIQSSDAKILPTVFLIGLASQWGLTSDAKEKHKKSTSGSAVSAESSEANLEEDNQTNVLVPETPYPCHNCSLSFTTKIGLGVHRRFTHPMEVNSEIDITRKKKRWSEEERAILAKTEAMVTQIKGPRHLNLALMKYFPERSQEGIKGQRRGEEYKRMVLEYLSNTSVGEAEPQVPGPGDAEGAAGSYPTSTNQRAARGTHNQKLQPDAAESGVPVLPIPQSEIPLGDPPVPPLYSVGALTRSRAREARKAQTTGAVSVRDLSVALERPNLETVLEEPAPRELRIVLERLSLEKLAPSGGRPEPEPVTELVTEPVTEVVTELIPETVPEPIPETGGQVGEDHLLTPSEQLHALLGREGRLNVLYGERQLNIIIRDALAGRGDVGDRLERYLNRYLKLETNNSAVRERVRAAERNRSRRQLRKEKFAKMQSLYKKDRSKCATTVLDGTSRNIDCGLEELEAYWRPVFSADSPTVPLPVVKNQPKKNVWSGVTLREVEESLPSSSSAPGPDGLTVKALKEIPVYILSKVYNIFLLMKSLPKSMLKSKTVFIPKKCEGVIGPGDTRPISMPSLLIRSFHRILARRLNEVMELNVRQKAFLPVDGCQENTFLLEQTILKAWKDRRELHVATLDLAKAFDSVSHFAIFAAAQRQGLPADFITYLRNVYLNGTTTFCHNGGRSTPVPVTRGVRQGDPLSPALFNAVIDEALDGLDPNIGFRMGNGSLNATGFADDLNMLGSTAVGLQDNLNTVARILTPKGLSFNNEKCRTLSLVPSGREKKVKVVEDGVPFTIQGRPIKKLSMVTPWTYLGVMFSSVGIGHKQIHAVLSEGLAKLRAAPLKPQQRLFILRTHLIPRFTHSLVLGRTRVTALNQMDILVRTAVRTWMRLPHDVPIAYIHASVQDGGLGVPSFRWTIARLKLNRLQSLTGSTDPIIMELTHEQEFVSAVRNAKGWCTTGEQALETKNATREFWRNKLYGTVDGAGLRESALVPAAHRWVSDGNRLLSGHEFIDMVRLRINALPTKARLSRGRQAEASCRAGCTLPSTRPARETLPHITQCCFRTHGLRVKRHDAVCRMLADRLRKQKWEVLEEPHLRTSEGLRKPDLVATREEISWVIDAQVVLDSVPLRRRHKEKTEYYRNNPDIQRLIMEKTGAKSVEFTSATLNWRGIFEGTCAKRLLALGLYKQDLKFISIRVLQGGLQMWRFFNRMTGQFWSRGRTGIG